MKRFGMFQDGDPHLSPESSSRYSLNANLTGNGAQPEESTLITPIDTAILSPDCVGRIPITNNQTVYFLRDNSEDLGIKEEIGIMNDAGLYQKIISFDDTNRMNLSREERLQGTFKVNYNGDIIIYWVQRGSVPRWLNITNPQIEMDDNRVAVGNLMLLQIFPDFLQCDIGDVQTSVGGGLVSGSYTVALGYATSQFNYTPVFYFSQPVDIVSSINTSPPTEYDGDPPGTATSKQITLQVGSAFSVDINFQYLVVYVGANINGVTTWYKYGDLPITGITMPITIQSLSDKETVPEEQILVPPAKYIDAKTITQLDDYLYMGNLRQNIDLGLQSYVNNIKVNYATEAKTINPSVSEAFREASILFKDKSFMWNEVYALYISFVLKDGSETKAYHIPGREAQIMVQANGTKNSYPIQGDATSQINKNSGSFVIRENTLLSDILASTEVTGHASYPQEATVGYDWSPVNEMAAVSPTAKYFDAFNTGDCLLPNVPNMGFHENANEEYPDNELWDIKDASGAVTGTLRGAKVRHHKFPHASYANNQITQISAASLSTYKEQKIIGIDISNIVLPADVAPLIHGVKIYYAKRTAENRTILGQSIILEDAGVQYYSNPFGRYSEQHVGANMRLRSISDGGGHTINVFPTSMWNEFLGTPSRTPAEYLTQSMFRNYLNTEDTYRNFVSMHNFDQMFFQDAVTRASYIKPVYKFQSQYQTIYIENAGGSSGATPITTTDDFEARLVNNTNDPVYGIVSNSVTRHHQKNSVRRFANNPVYMTANLQGDASTPNFQRDWTSFAAAFDKSSNPRNFYGEKYILGELKNRLADETQNPLSAPTRPYPKVDSGLVDLDYNSSVETANIATRTATFYLADLCAYRSDMYQNFENQELVCCGPLEVLHPTGPTYEVLNTVYSGDTVISFYGIKSHCELGGIRNSTAGNDRYLILKFLHYFICQSNANINFRYEDPSDTTRAYFPKTTAYNLLEISPLYDNWYGYDPMHNKLNDSRQPITQSSILLEETGDFPNRVIRSDKNNPESIYDNFLSFTANDYMDVGRNRGQLWVLNVFNNRLIIHNERGMFVTMGREVLKTTNLQAYVGSGDIFEVKPQEFTNMEAGFGGIQHQWAGVVTPYGYLFPDDKSGKVFLYNDGIKEISKQGMNNFFRETYGFRLNTYIVDSILNTVPQWEVGTAYTTLNTVIYNNKVYNCIVNNTGQQPDRFPASWEFVADLSLPLLNEDDVISGVGYHATYDVKYERYIMTKRDYIITQDGAYPSTYVIGVFNENVSIFDSGLLYYNGRLCLFSTTQANLPPGPIKETSMVIGGSPTTVYYLDDMRFIAIASSAIMGCEVVPYHYTMSFYPDDPTVGSFLSYTPEVYINIGNRFFSYDTITNWRHNSSDLVNQAFLIIYDTQREFIVEPILNEPVQSVKMLASLALETKCYDTTRTSGDLPRNVTSPRIVMETFDTYQIYNSYQISAETSGLNTQTQRYVDGYWRFNDFRDCVIDHDNPLFLTDGINREPNTANIDSQKHWSLKKRFVDYWFGTRLTYSGYKKLVLINIFGNVRKNAR